MIVHNVRDRRRGWIGPWEVEKKTLNVSRLTPLDLERTVIYQDLQRKEAGTLHSWRGDLVFVRFDTGDTAAGCDPRKLRFAIRDATGDFYRPPADLA